MVLLSAGVFLFAYKNAIQFSERQLDMAIETERRVGLFFSLWRPFFPLHRELCTENRECEP